MIETETGIGKKQDLRYNGSMIRPTQEYKQMGKRMLSRYDGKKQGWLRAAELFVVFLVVCFLAFQFFVGASRVSGNSMMPTYSDGDTVFFLRMSRDFSYGDVVSIKMVSGERYIKRVIAGPGDVVDLRDGCVYINGVPEDSRYAGGVTEPDSGLLSYPYTVEDGRYFVLGDNREASVDSRTFGTVSGKQILGRVLGK